MSPVEAVRRINRFQRTTPFKITASILLAALAVGLFVAFIVAINAPGEARALTDRAASEFLGPTGEALARAYADMAGRKADPTTVGIGLAAILALSLVVVWLGAGATYLGIVLAGALLVWPMYAFGERLVVARTAGGAPALTLRDGARFLAGVLALSASFSILVQALRAALAGGGPVLSIARNVVDEAVRLKVSLVFIILLIFGLAALPGLLDPTTPLRYRVQSFLQYGTGGTFWIIAVLVVFLAVATVSFEQRDRIIWQTMTKPVRAWEYVLGKWLGVSGMAAALLCVAAAGVFLFTDYLRFQPALEERAAFVPRFGTQQTEDRNILESQVLAARVGVRPTLEPPSPRDLERAVDDRLRREMSADSTVQDTPEHRARLRAQLLKERAEQYFSLRPGETRQFDFVGLQAARPARDARGRTTARPMTLRYKINAGGDDPRAIYRVTFMGLGPGVFFEDDNQVFAPAPGTSPPEDGSPPPGMLSVLVREVPPGQVLRLSVNPDAIDADGRLSILVTNGDRLRGEAPAESITFPPDGLEVFYAAGSYRMNFLRVVVVLWLKLAFLAMVGIVCGTFLSFPVASLMAFGILLLAESAGFLRESLEWYSSRTPQGEVVYYKVIIRAIAVPVAYAFQFYASLRPTVNLVDGRLVPWMTVVQAVAVLGGLTAVLFVAGAAIFRRRELAIYSGQ